MRKFGINFKEALIRAKLESGVSHLYAASFKKKKILFR